MNRINEFFTGWGDHSPETVSKLFFTLIAILILWSVRLLILKLALSRIQNVTVRYQWRKGLTYLFSFLGILLIGSIWIKAFSSISTFLGLFSAGLAVALREPVVNMAGWSYIILKRPFEIGHRIEINDQSGDVIDIQVFQFSMLEIGNWVDADQSTGRIIHIPNGMVFNQIISNYSKGLPFLWNEIPVLVTFESNWEKAKEILTEIAFNKVKDRRQIAEQKLKQEQYKYPIRYSKLEPVVYTSVKDSGIMLTIRYLCEPRNRRNSEQEVWEEALHRFGSRDDIDLAYPTHRVYRDPRDCNPEQV